MVQYRIEIVRAVRDILTHLPPELKHRVKTALRSLAADPYQAKELQEELAGLRSYRVGRTRLIFRVTGFVIEIVAFGPRSTIYERAAAELSLKLKKK